MKEQIKTNVRNYIAAHANLDVSDFTDDSILKQSPLSFDDTGLRFLARSLQDYVKSLKPLASIGLNELTGAGFTVKKTYELVIQKVGA